MKENELSILNNLKALSLKEILKENWSVEFETLMKNRMIMGFFRYGKAKKYNYVKYAKSKLQEYLFTGNTEYLVDVANLMLLEFMKGEHPKKHFKAAEQEEHNVEIQEEICR